MKIPWRIMGSYSPNYTDRVNVKSGCYIAAERGIYMTTFERYH